MVRRTAAITAASIAGVILAGGAAIGANIGILNAADDSKLGDLSAEAAVASPVSIGANIEADDSNLGDPSGEAAIVPPVSIGAENEADDSNLGDPSDEAAIVPPVSTTESPTPSVPIAETPTPADTSHVFIVDDAGEIEVDTSQSGLRISDVRTNQGWVWEELTASDGTVTVSFTSGGDELVFTASSNDDGAISAGIDRPAPAATPTQISAPSQASASNGSMYVDDDDKHEDDDHDEYEDDDDEYEGRDEDD